MAKKKVENFTAIDEKVYSPINDSNIRNDIAGSEIWNKCFREDEDFINDFANMYCYTIKFNGLTPIQVTKIERLK